MKEIKEQFQFKKIHKATIELITKINEILEEYQKQGYTCTIRQIYYQLVSQNIISNNIEEYQKISRTIGDARLNGLIDWNAIEDRTRYIRRTQFWDNPTDFKKSVIPQYKIDIWEGQQYYVEIWCEKDALIGIVEKSCEEYRVPFFSCRGYPSLSMLYETAQRIIRNGREAIIFHLGDADSTGLDVTRNITEQLQLLTKNKHPKIINVERIGLSIEQAESLKLPSQPMKTSDRRSKKFQEKHGSERVYELDAVTPAILDSWIQTAFNKYVDKDELEKWKCLEYNERETLYTNWIVPYLLPREKLY
ncbi:MAG: hypothetical protein LBC03_03595 [Nitrososphaerota archaeon]|nr:hypothetical protein [Nitrososphaerota archaeon]